VSSISKLWHGKAASSFEVESLPGWLLAMNLWTGRETSVQDVTDEYALVLGVPGSGIHNHFV